MIKILIFFITILSISTTYGGDFLQKFRTTYTAYENIDKTRTISVGLVFVNLEKYRNLEPDNLIYNQILSYSKDKPFGDAHGRSTNAHETVHGINSLLRNTYKEKLKKNVNGFYAGNNKGIIIENPKLTLREVIPNIPNVLRGYRYNLYFVKQLGDWNETPTYPMDEWVSYIAGAECAVDDDKAGIKIQKSDYVSGALEFSIYCTALALTVKNNDPDYWKNHKQFRYAIKYYLIKSEKVFFEGCEKFSFKEQTTLLDNLRNHDDAKNIRTLLSSEFEGIFID